MQISSYNSFQLVSKNKICILRHMRCEELKKISHDEKHVNSVPMFEMH